MIGRRLWRWTLFAGLGLALVIGIDLCWLGGTPKEWVKPERSLAFFGFVVGALVVAWQLARQHQNALDAQAQNARNVLNLEIYKDLAVVAEHAADSSQALITAVMSIQLDLHTRRSIFQETNTVPPANESHQEFFDRIRKAMSDALAVPRVMEKWEIALGRDAQIALRRAIFAHVDATRTQAFKFAEAVAGWIQPPGMPLGWPPTDDTLEKVTQHGAAVQRAVFDLVADLHDLRVFTQNGLLGELFTHRLEPRDPAEPTGIPLTVDARGQLRS
jgi:hypothetical protein